jgi:hypothetical protein
MARTRSFVAAEAIGAYVDLNEWQVSELARLDTPSVRADSRKNSLLKNRTDNGRQNPHDQLFHDNANYEPQHKPSLEA